MKTTTEERMTDVASRLPELGTERLEHARKKTSWTNRFRPGNIGYILHDKTCGVTWQVVRDGSVRCIRVRDDEWCYESLVMRIASLKMANIEVELYPYVLASPLIPNAPSQMMHSEPLDPEVVQ